MARRVLLLLVAVMLLPVVTPGARAGDAGRAGDAPNDRLLAWDEQMGALTGVLDDGWDTDCYRFLVPSGHYLRIAWSVDPTQFHFLQVWDEAGSILANEARTEPFSAIAVHPQSNAVRVCISNHPAFTNSVAYSLATSIHLVPELRVLTVDISEGEGIVPEQGIRQDRFRTVTVTGDNAGPGLSPESTLIVWSEHGESNSRHHSRRLLFTETFPLDAGEAVQRSFTWDSLGEVGHGTLRVQLNSAVGDLQPANNERLIGTSTWTDSALLGHPAADVVNHGAVLVVATAFVEYGYFGMTVTVAGPFLLAQFQSTESSSMLCVPLQCLAVPVGLVP